MWVFTGIDGSRKKGVNYDFVSGVAANEDGIKVAHRYAGSMTKKVTLEILEKNIEKLILSIHPQNYLKTRW